ncbi:lanthionine synthetase C family protein [Viridibacillus arvi]|uniref:lanthionine synthetase C family protein n=1 Tax=Viridibacillus arvi TaxID=263475 RepID=UPI003D08827A
MIQILELREKCTTLFEKDVINFAKQQSDTEFDSSIEHTLSYGVPGLCVLFSSLHKLDPSGEWDILAHGHLEKLNSKMELNHLDISLFQGLCGLGTSVLTMSSEGGYNKYLTSLNDLIEFRSVTLLKNFDGDQHLSNESKYDIFSGIVGIIRYMLHFKNHKNFATLINKLVVKVIAYANSEMEKAACLPSKSSDYVNLGTAHGLSGILSILSIAKLELIEVEDLDLTILKLISFFEDHSFVTMGVTTFPERLPFTHNNQYNVSINSSWCYGLTGVNRSLILAAEATENFEMKNFYINNYLAFLKAFRITSKRTSTIFCHGIAGIMYEAFLLYKDSKEDEFITHINVLLDCLIDNVNWDNANHFPDCTSDLTYLKYETGIVDGAISVYLVLLSLMNNKRFDIDWIFLKR